MMPACCPISIIYLESMLTLHNGWMILTWGTSNIFVVKGLLYMYIVYIYILIMISIGQYLYCTCRSNTFVCAWNFLFQPKSIWIWKFVSEFSNQTPPQICFFSNQILLNPVVQRQSCTNTACCPRKASEGYSSLGQNHASQEPIYSVFFFAKNQNQLAFAINDPSYECYIPNR